MPRIAPGSLFTARHATKSVEKWLSCLEGHMQHGKRQPGSECAGAWCHGEFEAERGSWVMSPLLSAFIWPRQGESHPVHQRR